MLDYPPGGIQFMPVSLPVIEAQSMGVESLPYRQGQDGSRVYSAAEQNHCLPALSHRPAPSRLGEIGDRHRIAELPGLTCVISIISAAIRQLFGACHQFHQFRQEDD
jgi:hypothetical protein